MIWLQRLNRVSISPSGFPVENNIDVNSGALNVNLATVMHGYGEKEAELVHT